MLFSKKKKYLDLKWGFGLLNLFLLVPFAGHVLNGFSYVSNQVDLGLWDDDRLYFCEGVSGVVYSDGAGRKKKIFVMVCGLLCTGSVCEGCEDTEKYGGCAGSGAGCVYGDFFWKYFSSGKVYVRDAQWTLLVVSILLNVSYQYSYEKGLSVRVCS